jgi:hypothetical protein
VGTKKRFDRAALITDPHEVWVPANFPRLAAVGSYERTSDKTSEYNCIAWVAHITDDWWWPELDSYWPDPSATNPTLDGFRRVFHDRGFRKAKTADHDWGYEKVCVYLNGGIPTHMARQLPSGKWTSKLGHGWDISHLTLEQLHDSVYGKAEEILRRRTVSLPLAIVLSLLQGFWRLILLLLRIFRLRRNP